MAIYSFPAMVKWFDSPGEILIGQDLEGRPQVNRDTDTMKPLGREAIAHRNTTFNQRIERGVIL
jgi:hypothetical protein